MQSEEEISELVRNIDTFDIWIALKGCLFLHGHGQVRYRLYLGRNAKQRCFLFKRRGSTWEYVHNARHLMVGSVSWLDWKFNIEQRQIMFGPRNKTDDHLVFTADSLVQFLEAIKFIHAVCPEHGRHSEHKTVHFAPDTAQQPHSCSQSNDAQ